MKSLSSQILTQFTNIQAQIWQTTSMTVSEAAGAAVNTGSAITLAARVSDLYAEFSAPMIVAQFSFATQPEHSQVLLMPQDCVADFLTMATGTPPQEIDENAAADLRHVLEGFVQGICLSVGNIKNETMVASGLNIRYQIFSFPPNLQKCDELFRVNVAVETEDFKGAVIWLLDNESVHHILGQQIVEDDGPVTNSSFGGFGGGGGERTISPLEDYTGLEMLMDIPLDISVELGRVRMLVKEVVDLGTGSIVELDKAAGEPVDVLVNGRLVARGEVVVIEDNFGVRVTEILSPSERIGKLGDAA